MLRFCLIAMLFLIGCSSDPGNKDEFCANGGRHARVIGIKDGDTVELLWRSESYVLRLSHIDCPERGQSFSKNAKQFVSDAVFNKIIKVECSGEKDRYGRYIGIVFTPEKKNLNLLLVENGYAWHFKKYSGGKKYDLAESQARDKKAGLWSDIHAIPPWEWRKKK